MRDFFLRAEVGWSLRLYFAALAELTAVRICTALLAGRRAERKLVAERHDGQ